MAITSRGYTETINDADWAAFSADLGFRYGVLEADAFNASAGAGTRQVKIGKGTAWGVGVLDVSDAAVTLTGASVAGQSRWDMIALRRDWGTGATSLVLVQGDSKAIPDRNTDPGTKDDQPLWLVRWAAGQDAPQEFVDLRVWNGDGGMIANDRMVRNYMNRLGTVLWIQGEFWVRGFNSTGNPAWMSAPVFNGTLTADQIRIATGGDVTGTGGNPGLIIGSENGANVGYDNNEIQARNNGSPSNLSINYDGGNVGIGTPDGSSMVTLRGDVRVPEPKISAQPATKKYVDVADNALTSRIDNLHRTESRTSGVHNAPGWVVSDILLTLDGQMAYFRASFTRNGADIVVPASGNIPNELIGTLTASGYLPRNVAALSHYSAGPLASAFIQANGDIYIAATANINSIARGTKIGFQGTYIHQA